MICSRCGNLILHHADAGRCIACAEIARRFMAAREPSPHALRAALADYYENRFRALQKKNHSVTTP